MSSDEIPPPPFSSRVSVDIFGMTDKGKVRANNEDQLLLCTDGLTGMVDDVDIELILKSARSAKSACRNLVDMALKNGGRDNVTVIIARYSIPPSTLNT